MNNPHQKRLFLSPPHLGGDELNFVHEAFASNYIAPLGPMVDAFEREFAAYTGIPHCVALASGTAAMHLALRELGVGPGDSVLASTLTFIGSVTPATFLGASVTFMDADAESWNLNPDLLVEELAECARRGRLPKAVIPTDLYGQCCDLERIKRVCERYEIPVVADAAEAMGARHFPTAQVEEPRCQASESALRSPHSGLDRPPISDFKFPISTFSSPSSVLPPPSSGGPLVRSQWSAVSPGSISGFQFPLSAFKHAGFGARAAVFSFNGNKIMTTSGGGLLASHDARLIEHARKLSQQARDPAPHYEHTEIGYNYRMSNILAAIGRGQLRVLDERVAAKRRIFGRYRERLADLPGITFMPEPAYSHSNRWLTVILVDEAKFGSTPEQIRLALEAENIESRPVWKPMHLQPVFKHCRVCGGEVSERLFRQGLCLPSGTAMTDADQDRVVSIIRRIHSSPS